MDSARDVCRWLLRYWFEILTTTAAVAALSFAGHATLERFRTRGLAFEDRIKLAEMLFLALGLGTATVVRAQMRQTATWNRLLSYHQFFDDIPAPHKVRALQEVLMRLGISREVTRAAALTEAEVRKFLEDKPSDSNKGLTARRVLQAYLNDFEELCAAVNAGVVEEEYARAIEGARVINTYFGYQRFIKSLIAEELGQLEALNRDPAYRGPRIEKYRSKYYCDLKLVAIGWLQRREMEEAQRERREWLHRRKQMNADGTPRRVD